jgi:hypothetical protein
MTTRINGYLLLSAGYLFYNDKKITNESMKPRSFRITYKDSLDCKQLTITAKNS